MLGRPRVIAAVVSIFLASAAVRAFADVQVSANGTVPPNPVSVARGAAVSAAITNGPGNARDWVGFYPVGGNAFSYVDWFYLNGSKTPPATGVTSATVNFTAPQT